MDGWMMRISETFANGRTNIEVWYVREEHPVDAERLLRDAFTFLNDAVIEELGAAPSDELERLGVEPGGARLHSIDAREPYQKC